MEVDKLVTKLDSKKEEKTVVTCEECKKEAYKYKCPGCCIRTCSLVCVKSHKQRTNCTGKQNTQFLPMSQFNNNVLFSDYNLLEEMKRVAESAQRGRAKLGVRSHFYLPYPLKSLRNAAGSRSTKLTFLPNGMSKRVTNQSSYNSRNRFISWTIEWRFHSTKVVIVDHGINENRSLCSVIDNHLKPGPWTHPLRQFSEEPLESLRFFICKYPKGSKSPFRELDIKSPIRQQLANLYLVEYPVIHVFLPSHSFNFDIVKEVIVKKPAVKECVVNDPPSPKGVIFKEEEIEETNSSDPKIFDLIKQSNPNHVSESTSLGQINRSGVEKDSAPRIKPELEISENFGNALDDDDFMQPISGFDIDDIDDIELGENIDFDFEQGLLDAYSDLIAQHNPDDFLDFENDLENDLLGDLRNETDFKEDEELEEGEIPEI